MPLDKLAAMLNDFGLTSLQAKVYLAAVQLGLSPASQISQASNVRREETYRVLNRLEKIGLVEKISGNPVTIRAVSLKDALYILTKQWENGVKNKARVLEDRKDEVLEYFKAHKKPISSGEEKHFELLLEQDILVNKLSSMLEDAAIEISLISSKDELNQLLPASFAQKWLETVAKKRVNTRIILEVSPQEASPQETPENYLSKVSADVRYSSIPLSHYCTVDYKQVLMATSREASIGKVPYLWTDDDRLVRLLQRNFEDSWHSCVSLGTQRSG